MGVGILSLEFRGWDVGCKDSPGGKEIQNDEDEEVEHFIMKLKKNSGFFQINFPRDPKP